MELDVNTFQIELDTIQKKLSNNKELNEYELHVLLIAHLMEEERNELSPKKT